MNLETIKGQVEWVLANKSDSRNSDVTLMVELWKRFYPKYIKQGSSGEYGVWLRDLHELPLEDTIGRMRRVFQNDLLKYLPTSREVAEQRKLNMEMWHSFMKNNN